jgi:hypothetical protein
LVKMWLTIAIDFSFGFEILGDAETILHNANKVFS